MKSSYPIAARNPSLTLMEPFRAVMELAFQQFATPQEAAAGDGHPVIIFPGLGADGTSVSILRAHCQKLGYDAFDWGQGFNTGPRGELAAWLEGLAHQISDQLAKHEKPATLIGWSLGGLYARELGKLLAPRLRQVITIATPFNGGADDGSAAWLSSVLGGGAARIDPSWIQRLRIPPPYARHPSTADRMVWSHGKPAVTTNAPGSFRTSKWTAAIWVWAGTSRS